MTRAMSQDKTDEPLHGEEAIIQGFLAPLARGFPGAFGLKDDCALLTPEPGTELVLKTDPVAEGVHFLPDDAPERRRLEGAGGQRVRPGRQGRHPDRLSDGAVVSAAPAAAEWLAAFAARAGGRPSSNSAAI